MAVSVTSYSIAYGLQSLKLYDYDDYEECRREYSDFVYCTVKSHLSSNASSTIWREIQHHSTHPRHFDRRVIEVGFCLQKCRTVETVQPQTHNVSAVLQTCVERKIWALYHLNSTTEIMRCISSNNSFADNSSSTGIARIIFICSVVGVIAAVFYATVADNQQTDGVAEKNLLAPTIVVESFSLSRNLRRLIKRDDKAEINLRHLDGIRALTMMIILLTHCSIPMIRMPLKNVDQLEAQFNQWWFPIAMAGNTYTVQIFFVIGGLLLAVNMMEQTKNSTLPPLTYILNRIKLRLIRILPLYLFVIFFHASWYPRLYDGPIGDRYKDHCTTNWWTNVLFLNNYIHPSKPCIQFAWYLGADFQLYVLGTVLMMLIRVPRLVKPIAICMALIALLVPMVVIYNNRLDATVMMIVRYILEEIRTLPYYIKMYIPFETNAGNYFFGMFAGILYYNFRNNPAAVSILKLRYLLPSSAIFFVAMNGLTVLLPSDHLSHPSMALAFYGSMLKSAWGIFPSVVLLHMAFQKTPSMLLSTLQHPVFLVGSKLSYSVYLLQYGIIYATYKHITYPIMYDSFTILFFTAAIVNITFCMSFILHLFIEQPFSTMLRRLLMTSKKI
ncbi:O-acyltransferase like protein-like [Anopheles nili]|uniref:O-acyltransferase like protein-like n=1 Tax=Anopheles nili TaxID=185578 RepID=UPI00237B3F55|nr:O-acyltransferase like protein-like [Anopheles nili]